MNYKLMMMLTAGLALGATTGVLASNGEGGVHLKGEAESLEVPLNPMEMKDMNDNAKAEAPAMMEDAKKMDKKAMDCKMDRKEKKKHHKKMMKKEKKAEEIKKDVEVAKAPEKKDAKAPAKEEEKVADKK